VDTATNTTATATTTSSSPATVAGGGAAAAAAAAVPEITFEDFRDAFTVALTYGQTLPAAAGELAGTVVLVPFVDLLNHSADPALATVTVDLVATPTNSRADATSATTDTLEEAYFLVVARNALAAGAEMFRNYGLASREAEVYRFGFASYGHEPYTQTSVLPNVFDDVFGDRAALDAFAGLHGGWRWCWCWY
jgi:hypothetical protein